MNSFTLDEMSMLTDGGWAGDFIENIEDGDAVAIKTGFARQDEPAIKFVTVAQLRRIARYERDLLGDIIDANPNYLMQFIGVHESGVREPMTFGSGWGVFIRREEKA